MSKQFQYSQLTDAQRDMVAEHIALFEAQRGERKNKEFDTVDGRAQTSYESATALREIDFKNMNPEDRMDLAERLKPFTNPNHEIYENIPGHGAPSVESLERAIELAQLRPNAFERRMNQGANYIGREEWAEAKMDDITRSLAIDAASAALFGGVPAEVAVRGVARDALLDKDGNPLESIPILGSVIGSVGNRQEDIANANLGNLAPPGPAVACQANPDICQGR